MNTDFDFSIFKYQPTVLPAADPVDPETDADSLWQMTLDELVADPDFPPELISMLRTAKVELRSAVVLDNDMIERLEERAAIMQHDGGLEQREAEQQAFRIVSEDLTQDH